MQPLVAALLVTAEICHLPPPRNATNGRGGPTYIRATLSRMLGASPTQVGVCYSIYFVHSATNGCHMSAGCGWPIGYRSNRLRSFVTLKKCRPDRPNTGEACSVTG
jgi:hypothetical protein